MNVYKTVIEAIEQMNFKYKDKDKALSNIGLKQLKEAIEQIKTNNIVKYYNTIYVVDKYNLLE